MSNRYSDFLFPAPDPYYSAGQILDLLGTPQHYNVSDGPDEADRLALARDWAAVGEDLRQAFLHFGSMLR